MAQNIFQSAIKSVPKSDAKIVRVDMEQQDIGGRKSHLPAQSKSEYMGIDHVPNADSKS
jgi:hypothetical protein